MLRTDHSGLRSSRPLLASAIAAALVFGLPACSRQDGAAGGQATQVAAKVGDTEISVHQINQVLNRTAMEEPSAETLQTASRQILERLIDQQVAVNAATEENLQRSPEVIAAIEAARREVLARAYLQKLAANAPKASPEEVAGYYRDHPALFAERRVFNIQEVRVTDASAVLADLRSLAEQGKTVDEVAEVLRGKQVPFNTSAASRSAEQLPLDVLPRFHALKDGQAQVFESGKAATFVRVVSSQTDTMTEQEAAPVIEKFLNNRYLNQTVQQEIKRLREATTIAYQGEFSAPAAEPANPAAPAVAAPAQAAPEQGAIDRGVQGLK